jgi:hypothetical protein
MSVPWNGTAESPRAPRPELSRRHRAGRCAGRTYGGRARRTSSMTVLKAGAATPARGTKARTRRRVGFSATRQIRSVTAAPAAMGGAATRALPRVKGRSETIGVQIPKHRRVSAYQRQPNSAVPSAARSSSYLQASHLSSRSDEITRPSPCGLRPHGDTALTLELADSPMELAMAVRAQHRALEKLRRDDLPSASHAIA